jgi:hypothetical protein
MIKVRRIKFKGKEYTDVRKFFADKDTGDLHPTRKGIAIPDADLPTIITELERQEAACLKPSK